jgi:hypothetical protein
VLFDRFSTFPLPLLVLSISAHVSVALILERQLVYAYTGRCFLERLSESTIKAKTPDFALKVRAA